MNTHSNLGRAWLGLCLLVGLVGLGLVLGRAAVDVKAFERSVTAKGLSEREYAADVVIWPVTYAVASNDLESLYATLENHGERIAAFLAASGFARQEITMAPPVITDKSAQAWGDAQGAPFRYVATRNVTVYSERVAEVRAAMNAILDLGREGIVFAGDPYVNRVEYLFTRLNEVKPAMVEEATRNARDVAQKFAQDSDSRLGKIRRASQGQFSIEPRDTNNPHIKRVRVVSTVEYYLAD